VAFGEQLIRRADRGAATALLLTALFEWMDAVDRSYRCSKLPHKPQSFVNLIVFTGFLALLISGKRLRGVALSKLDKGTH